jgi:hypothetical protein
MFVKARSITRYISPACMVLLVTVMTGLLPLPAFAQVSGDLSDASKQFSTQVSVLAKFIAFFSYVIGTAFATRGLFALRRHIEAPEDNPLGKVIGFCCVAALLILLPWSIGTTQKTIGAGDEGGLGDNSSISSTSGNFSQNVTSCKTGTGTVNAVFCNLVQAFSPFASFLALCTYVMATFLGLTGLLNLKAYGDDPSQTPLRSIIIKFALAAMLISLPLAMQVFVTSVTGAQSIDTVVQVKKPSLYSGSLR